MTEIRPRMCPVICTLLSASMAVQALILGGCAAPGDKKTSAPADAVLESKVVEIDDGSAAHARKWADGRVRVEIEDANADLRFAAEFRKTDNAKVMVVYELYLARAEENMSPQAESSSLELDMKEPPPLDHAITSAVFIHTQLSRAVLGLYDNWGCDLLPRRFNWVASCGPKGRCCDIHDACYARHRCTASSWTKPPWNKCQVRCNAPAVACFGNAIPVGPSVCCRRGNCGRPR
jgi:hypothetical protein